MFASITGIAQVLSVIDCGKDVRTSSIRSLHQIKGWHNAEYDNGVFVRREYKSKLWKGSNFISR